MTIKVTYNVTDVYVTQDVSPVYINVSYSTGSSGGSAVWGGISGTLSDQTDLQTALDAKVPYSGATTNVNLGEYEIKAGQVTLDTSPTGTAAVGTTRWNDTLGSTETTLKGGNVILKNGVDLVARVVNKVSPNTTLTKAAYQAVRVSGAQGQRLAVAFAQANNDNNSADTIGLVTETIATNQEGFIITVGQLENINTTGSLQGETWADGDVLYLSPTTAGALTNVKPNATIGHIVVIGYVEYAHANNGKIYVKVMNGWELGELHDVYVPTPSNNDVLTYETSSGLWKNKSIATALGYTPANAATTLTINGVTYDLSANRTWTVSGGISGSGAAGQVAYWTGTSAQAGSNNLFWDATNSRLGIGTSSPAVALDVRTSANSGSELIRITNSSSGSSATTGLAIQANVAYGSLFATSSTYALLPFLGANAVGFYSTHRFGIAIVSGDFSIGTTSSLTERFRLFGSTGNVLIQNGGTFTDSGERLQVTGNVKIVGSGATSATTALTVQNSSAINLVRVRNDGYVFFGTQNTFLFPTADGSDISTSGRGLFIGTNAAGQGTGAVRISGSSSITTGNDWSLWLSHSFAPTSGTASHSGLLLNQTINQTGGANGITRGLYVNPTLTAAADFRAIETTNGKVIFGNLPTSSAGLPTGAIWNDAGTLKIV